MNLDLQKASFLKRVSAYLLDSILMIMLAVSLALVLSAVFNYGSHLDTLNECYDKYETQYNVRFDITWEEYESLSEEALQRLNAAEAAISSDPVAVHANHMIISLTLLILSGSILLAYLALEFAVPLLLGNGQTIGKKIFAIAVMRQDSIKINAISLFVRTVLGKFTIETMIPVLIILMILWGTIGVIGPIILFCILILEIVVYATSHTGAFIHDYLARTIAVDLSSQLIFENEEELIAYKEKLHAEQVSQSPY